MKHLLLLLFLTGINKCAFAQREIVFPFTSDDDNRMINETDSGKYFVADEDTTNIIFINDEAMACRVLNKDHKLISEGNLSEDQDKYLQEDKWTEYYDNGKIKCTGYYYKGHPIGLWQKFYPNGKPKSIYNYSIINQHNNTYYCLAGVYKDYYENGQIKTDGFYLANMDQSVKDSVLVTDPVTNEERIVINPTINIKSEKFGKWLYYTESGALDKKEDN